MVGRLLTGIGGWAEINTTIAHLRDVLGDQTYESLARTGAEMTTAEMVPYAYDQIDQARTTLEHPSWIPRQKRRRSARG